MCFPRGCLPVGEYSPVEPLQNTGDNWFGCNLVDLLLGGVGVEDVVEIECVGV